MIKETVSLTILALVLPLVAFATGSVDFINRSGTLSGVDSNSGMTLPKSTVMALDSFRGGLLPGNSLDMLSFGTGALSSTTLKIEGTFAAGIPESGTLGLLGVGLFGIAGVVRRKLKLV